jgi:Protein of unknown function (DUF1565)
MWTIFAVLLIGVLGLGSLRAEAATSRYVSLSGNDSNAGTLASPFRTFGKAVSVTAPGDTIFIRGGTYLSDAIDTIPCGTSSALVTVRNYQNEQAIMAQNERSCHQRQSSGNSFVFNEF